MWERWADYLLRREAAAFSAPMYRQHRRRFALELQLCLILPLVFLVLAAAIGIPVVVYGLGSTSLSAVTGAVFLFVFLSTIARITDSRHACLLPYFARPLGDIDTFLGGEALLWHSAELDAIACDLGCTPLGHFLSGDSLITGEECTLLPPDDALATVAALCRSPRVAALDPAVGTYLEKLHHALRRAARDEIRFCLHLREGTIASGHEMDLRKGSYF